MKRPESEFGLNILIVAGILVVFAGIVLHWTLPERFERIEVLPIIVGMALSLFGASWKDPNRARRAAGVVTESGRRVVKSYVELRTGKGAKDPTIRVEKTVDPAAPDAPPEVTVQVTAQGDRGELAVEPDPNAAATPLPLTAEPDVADITIPPLAKIPAKERGDI